MGDNPFNTDSSPFPASVTGQPTAPVPAAAPAPVPSTGFGSQQYGGASAAGPAPGTYAPAAEQGCLAGFKQWHVNSVRRTMRLFNLINGILVLVIYPTGILTNIFTIQFQSVFLTVYSLVFGALLCCFECHISKVDVWIRKHFGFLFSYRGRVAFLCFVATLGLAGNWWGGILVGVLTFLNAIFQGFCMMVHPAFKSGLISAKDDPTKGYTTGDAEAKAFVKSRPDLAKKAFDAGVSVAKSNPELGAAAMTAGADYARSHPDEAMAAMSAGAGAYGGSGAYGGGAV